MLLVIDAGNTNIVFAIYDDERLIGKWRLSANAKRTSDEYAMILQHFLGQKSVTYDHIDAVMISSVVPQGDYHLKLLCTQHINAPCIMVGDSDLELGMNVQIDQPNEVGADRLVNAVAAQSLYDGDIVVIDFGTATNFDVIQGNGTYIGGVIAPGIHLSLDALHKAAAKLPDVDIAKPSRVIGTNTVHAMQSGVYWGYIGLINGLIAGIKEELSSDFTAVTTGGLASLFSDGLAFTNHLEPDLTIIGLHAIYQRNRS